MLLMALFFVFTASGADEAVRTDKLLSGYVPGGGPGCAAGVVWQGKVVYAKGFGLASLEHGAPITPKSVFYLASVSKQFMAFAILLLEQQGKLSVDDPVGKHVAQLPAHTAAITLRQLLHHTGGVRDYLTIGALSGFSADHVWTEHAFLRTVARQGALNFAPGTEHLYSNSGYVLLSLAAQKVIGGKLDPWMKANVWGPLGMEQSRWQHDHRDPVEGRALGYSAAGSNWKISNSMLDTVGDGGMYSSLADLLRWAANFDEGKPGARLLERMGEPGKLADGRVLPGGYGMGLARGTYRGLATVAHGGALGGYRTMLLRVPQERFTVVSLCNNGRMNTNEIAQKITDVWLEGKLGAVTPQPARKQERTASKPKPTTAEQRQQLSGDWFSAELEAVYRLRDVNGKLMLEAGEEAAMELFAAGEGKVGADGGTLELRNGILRLDAGRVRGIEFRRWGGK